MNIDPAIDLITHPFTVPVAPGIALERFVHCYIIYGEKITLIDTGVAGCEGRIFDAIRSRGRDPSEIDWIILTHSHPDHIGAAHTIQMETNCRIAAHPAEREWIQDVNRQNQDRPVPGFHTLVSGSVQIDRLLNDGDRITDEKNKDLHLTILHTPGHSPGSISLFMEEKGILFSGDAVPVPGDLPVYDDASLSVESIRRLAALPTIQVLLSAWDEPQFRMKAYERLDSALLYLKKIHDSVFAEYEAGTSDLMELTRKVAPVIGFPPQAVTPLLARTFDANLRVIQKEPSKGFL